MTNLHFTQVLSHALVPSLSTCGGKFGGEGGNPFQNFTSPCHVSGVVMFLGMNFIEGLQLFYSCPSNLNENLTAPLHGSSAGTVKEELYLSGSERISKVQVIVGTSYGETIKNIRFFTTSGRSSASLAGITGTILTEEYVGCTLGYITGRAGLYIDQLMFHWYC